MPEIFRILESEHRRISAVVDQISDGRQPMDQPARRLLLDRLIAAESNHEAAEELAFWPVVRRRLPDGRQVSDEGRRQEADARYVLDALRFPTGDADMEAQMEQLGALVRRHIQFEQEEVWPALRRVTGPLGAHLLGWRYRAALRAAPTRPHPGGPDGPLGLATVGAAAAVGDRLIDHLGGRHRRLAGGLAPSGRDPVDPLEFLAGEHRRIEGLLRRLEEGDGLDDRVLAEVVRELSIHDAIERQHLYPLIRTRAADGNTVYGHALSEHARIAAALSELDRRPESDPHRQEEAKRVARLVRAHVAEEEGEMFPPLRPRLSPQEMAELGDRLVAARAKAPTRPHPHAAGAGLGARMVGMVAGPLDRARDALSRRR